MDYREDYQKAFETKKEAKGVYLMNKFCSEIEEIAKVDDIPAILKLYYDRSETNEQNEFVTEVINRIAQKHPKEAAESIVNNIRILIDEKAEECLTDILFIFTYWNKKLVCYLLEALKKTDKKNSQYIIDSIKSLAEENDDEMFQEFLKLYYTH